MFQINTQRSDHTLNPKNEKIPPIFALSASQLTDQLLNDVLKVGFDDYSKNHMVTDIVEAPLDV